MSSTHPAADAARLAQPAPPLHVEEAFKRFEAEAEHGVAELSRYRCRYVAWGDGPPLVMIHGLADRLRSFALSMAALQRHFRCISYDQPTGEGDGSRLRDYTHDLLVSDLFEFLDHVGMRQATLLGHSFGSTVMFKALAAVPERFTRGVAVCGFAHRPLTRRERFLAWLGQFAPGRLKHLPFREKAMHGAHAWAFAPHEAERWTRFHNEVGEMPIATLAYWARHVHETRLDSLLPTIRQPVLLVYGDRDVLIRRCHHEVLFQNLPNAVQFEIAQCGHFPLWTHPEAVAGAVRQFLLGSCERAD